MQACSGQPDRTAATAAVGDRDCNSNELAKSLLLLALSEQPASAADGGVQYANCCPVAPPRTKRRSKQGDQADLAAVVPCGAGGGTRDSHRTSGSEESEGDGASGKRAEAAAAVGHHRCRCGLPNAGSPAGGAAASGLAPCCARVRCSVAEEALAAAAAAAAAAVADGSLSSFRICTPDGSDRPSAGDRPSASEGRAETATADGGACCYQNGALTRRESPLPPLLPRPPCEGCAAADVAPETGGVGQTTAPRDASAMSSTGTDSAAGATAASQVVVVLRRKPQRSPTAAAVESSRRRSSRMSQHKRASGLRAGGAASAAAAAAATLAEKAASLRQKFVALKTRAKGMQQKDTEIKMKFQDLQKRRNVLKSLSRSSVVRASKLGGAAAALELGGGSAADLV